MFGCFVGSDYGGSYEVYYSWNSNHGVGCSVAWQPVRSRGWTIKAQAQIPLQVCQKTKLRARRSQRKRMTKKNAPKLKPRDLAAHRPSKRVKLDKLGAAVVFAAPSFSSLVT
jgi:hypothetical protein